MPRRLGSGLLAALCLAALGCSVPRRARADKEPTPSFELSVAPELSYGLRGARCERPASDLVTCTSLGTLGLELAPRARLAAHFAVGGLVRLGWAESMTALQLAAEGRFMPLTAALATPWVGVDLGTLLLFDRVAAGELGPAQSFARALPCAGVGLGLDFALGRALALGLLLRVAYALSHAPSLPGRRPSYDDLLLLSGGIALTWRLDG